MSKSSAFLFCVFLMLCAHNSGLSQFEPSRLDYYDELKGTLIYDILPDQKGNIWIASIGGLVKYDGYDFKFFHPDPEDSTTVDDLLTYSLYEQDDGTIWIGSMDEVYRYDPNTKLFKTYPFTALLEYPDVGQPMAIFINEGTQGRMYIGVTSGIGLRNVPCLIYYDPEEDELKRIRTSTGNEPKNLYNITKWTDGNILTIAENGAFKTDSTGELEEFDISFIDIEELQENGFPIEIKKGDEGTMWMITRESKLGRIDPDGGLKFWDYSQLFRGRKRYRFMASMEMDDQGDILIPGEFGIVHFDVDSEEMKTVGQSLIEDRQISMITVLRFDSFGNLWGGTYSSGLFKFPNRNFLPSYGYDADDPNSVTQGWVSEIFESDDGRIWFSSQGGLNVIDPVSGNSSSYPYNEILPGQYNISMYNEVAPGEILFSSNEGLAVYSTNTGDVKPSDFEIIEDEVFFLNDLMRDREGTFWLSTNNGIFRMKDKEIKNFSLESLEQSEGPSNEVTKIIESKFQNGYWIQTNGGVFFMDKQSDELTRHGFDQVSGSVFSSQDINALYEDDDGILWIGTWQGGLNRYNPKTGEIKIYSMDDGLPSMSIQGILGDEENGALWMSTFSGITRFNIAEEQFMNFGLDDGVQSLLYADGAALETSGGLFAFGGSDGINLFDPSLISENSVPPYVEITDFKTGDESIFLLANGECNNLPHHLNHDQNNISIAYTGIHYDNPDQNEFAYMIEGYDEEWRNVGQLRTAYYYNLDPGTYKFMVKAANVNGVWSDPEEISFEITPPWWRTWWAYLLFTTLILSIVFFIYRIQRRRIVEKERAVAREKELEQAKEIEKAYKDLKATQAQLIQSEKMASLGELTAGIAHEIQNPLNFVNNFSELSSELVAEAKEELVNGDVEETKAILDDIVKNLEKIHHHGGRASSIVKGMLDHSRTSAKEKSPTDINALCDEYLRLAFHGLRAKDKSFNASFETKFDEDLKLLNVIPQDIGRVLLNVINNAFYTVDKKSKSGLYPGYEPKLIVSTEESKDQNGEDQVIIRIRDNGEGMEKEVMAKVFQPFFTTKPTGQGTGLGMSISYDIITKGHGGNLSVQSELGQGTEFVIELPFS